MARPLRVAYPEAWYHVMNRGAARAAIFLDDRDRSDWISLVAEMVGRYRVEIHAFCLMGNHFHLLVRTPEANLSRAIRHLCGVYAQRFNLRHGRDGPLFRGRFKAILVEAEEYLLQVSRYIHLNPIAANLVRRPEQYRWSSYRGYLRPGSGPEWLSVREVLGRFGSRHPGVEYAAYVGAGLDDETRAFYGSRRIPPAYGSDAFRERVLLGLLARADPEIPDRKGLLPRPRPDRILRETGLVFEMDAADIVNPQARVGAGVARAVAMQLCRDWCGVALLDIASAFGLSRAGSVATLASRVRKRLEVDVELRAKVARIRERIECEVDG